MIVGIDAGHGGSDKGAPAGGILEAPLNLELAQLFAAGIKALGAADAVLLRPRAEDNPTLAERAAIAAAFRCDLVLSVHCNTNADPAVPGGTFYHWPGAETSRAIAETLARCWPEPLRRPPTGRYRQAVFSAEDKPEETSDDWLRRARAVLAPHQPRPAVLIEACFLTHPEDAEAINDTLVRETMVPAVLAAVYRARFVLERTAVLV